jgi:hypothetical protein
LRPGSEAGEHRVGEVEQQDPGPLPIDAEPVPPDADVEELDQRPRRLHARRTRPDDDEPGGAVVVALRMRVDILEHRQELVPKPPGVGEGVQRPGVLARPHDTGEGCCRPGRHDQAVVGE